MCEPASNAADEPSGDDRADILRQTIERDYPLLIRRIGVLVYRLCGRLRSAEIEDRVTEVLNEAVKRALQSAERFDPTRSATAWLIGFALHVLQEQRRARRIVVQSDLGEEIWHGIVEELASADDADAATVRLDIRQALARLEEPQRHILELRYFSGLDGQELAQAVDAPTSGAARVRLARALQALRAAFGATGEEESHE